MAISVPEAANDSIAAKISADEAKSYIRIGELAREFEVTPRALRFYEDKGLLKPKRRGSTRLYSEQDRTQLKLVLLGRKIGFPLRDVKHILDLYDSKGVSAQQLKLFLQKSEKQMEWLEKQYAEIEEAVIVLTDLIGQIRDRLAVAPEQRPGGLAAK